MTSRRLTSWESTSEHCDRVSNSSKARLLQLPDDGAAIFPAAIAAFNW